MRQTSRADVLIVGGGYSAGRLASSLRAEGFQGSIHIVGEESRPPYDRPLLSKGYLHGITCHGRLDLRSSTSYGDNAIDIETGVRVDTIDPRSRTIRCTDGRVIGYGHLVLATGARPRRLDLPGADLGAISCLRTIDDADRLRSALREVSNLAVIGGGFVGLEVATTVVSAASECRVTVLEAKEQLLSRSALPETAEFVAAHHRALGIDVRVNARVSEFRGRGGHVETVVTTDGVALPADVVVYGIGVEPRTELAREAGLEVSNGIVVDETLHTDAEGIWAIGDCCTFPVPLSGQRIRLESVQNATDQARHLAVELASGRSRPYVAVPWFWSDQGKMRFQSVGLTGQRDTTAVVGETASGSFSVLAIQDGKLIGGDSVNATRDHLALKRLLTVADPSRLTAIASAARESRFSLSEFALDPVPGLSRAD